MQSGKLVRLLLSALGALAIVGCATPLSPDQMRSETAGFQLPKLPDPGKAMVYVVRPSGLGGLVRFNVFLGDKDESSEMGYTRSSQYIYFHVPPGEHKILSKAENWAETYIRANAGDVLYVRQDPAMGVVIARNSVVRIEDYEGKYYVKTLQPGTIHKIDK